jgi:protein-S-isoprenylcysteine O-methyltransferase Ste14
MGMLGLPVVALATPILDWARYAVYGPVAGLGCGLALAGLWIFRRAHVDLGRNWSPTLELREGHRIIQTGIYARVRHPMYLAIILLTLAQAAMFGNWLAGPAGLIAFLALYLARVTNEERMMQDRFGPEWQAYVARTGRLLPRMTRATTETG